MAEVIDTQPSGVITTFKQAHELRADWANATSLAWDGSRYYLMIVEENTGNYVASTSKDRSATGAVAVLEDWITETGRVPHTLCLDGAKSLLAARCKISVASTISTSASLQPLAPVPPGRRRHLHN